MKMPFRESQSRGILLISAATIMGSAQNNQVNPLIAALIIFSFILIRNKQDFWAALMMIALGTATIKLYGIVGLAFFFFSDNKLKLVLGILFWSVVLFAAADAMLVARSISLKLITTGTPTWLQKMLII